MNYTKFLAPAVVAALVIAAGIYTFASLSGGGKTVTAQFPRTVSLYEGSDVRVLGVSVGQVTDVTPSGTTVVVEMSYDEEVDVPANAKAVIVAPSVVGDRYVQLTPAYDGGDVLSDGADLGLDRTSVPLELDDIYASLDQLVVALGPNGANAEGALTDLLQQTAANFGGQGAKLNQTIKDVSTLTTTLDDNSDQLFGSARQLQKFVSTLAENDGTVREFATSLEEVSEMLAGERKDLASAMRNLATALGDVEQFVKENRGELSRGVKGLNRTLGVVVKNRDSLDEALKVAPLALNNLLHAYNPDTGTLDANANIGKLTNGLISSPSTFLCNLVQQGTGGDKNGQKVCDLLGSLLPRGEAFGQGTGTWVTSRHDPTLGGLVEVP